MSQDERGMNLTLIK
ncbi:mCG146559, isoform CRA_c [Mus musculus]|nr:mCG146559, isoform CRA_c [Mus musculus]